MENAPLNETEEEKESKKDKKKSRLGLVAVESKPEEPKREAPKDEKPERAWWKLGDAEQPKPEAAEKDKPQEQEVETLEAEEGVEAEEVSEAEAPTEEIGAAERDEEVIPKLVEVIEELEAQTPPDPVTDPPVTLLRERIKAGENKDEVFEDIMTDLDAEVAEAETIAKPVENETDVDEAPEVDPSELIIPHGPEALDAEDEPDDPVAGTTTTHQATTPPPPPPTPPHGPAGGGPQGPYGPHGPAPPFQPGGPGGPAGPGGPGGPGWQGGFNPNAAPVPPVAAAANRQPREPEYHHPNPAAMALFGGIIGYLIGRRRGRIRTEKRLLPIQKKLEEQVNDLQWDLQAKEKRLRQAAAAKVERDGPAVVEVLAAKAVAIKAEKQDRPRRALEQLRAERKRAPEAHQLHGGSKAHERIGHVLVAETIPAAARPEAPHPVVKAETKSSKPDKLELPPDKRIETLSRAELLAMSEKIMVEGTTLRQIYETHLIGERGLRRLIGEYLRGGDVKKALRQEVVEREMDFERDPAMRDIGSPGGAAVGGGAATLDRMIEKAANNVSGEEEAAFIRARADYQASQEHQQHKHRQLMDLSLISIILILLGLLVLLLVRHG